MNEHFDSFDILALSFGYTSSARGTPDTYYSYYSHPTLGHELEVRRGVELYDSWWRWRPGPDSIEGASLNLPWEQRPHSGMSPDGLKAVLSRVHNGG